MRPLRTVIPCVHYDDFLRLTLPRTMAMLSWVTVLTSPRDPATAEVARQLGAELFTTEAWHARGPLNKAAALNAWLVEQPLAEDPWLMVLDADVLLCDGLPADLEALDPRGLYSLRRRMCPHLEDYRALLRGARIPQSFALEEIPLLPDGLWSKLLTRNSAALAGYLQLWRPAARAGLPRFPETGTAEGYDLLFALSFPEHRRRFLDPLCVLHLGPVGQNWHGRRSPRWDEAHGQFPP